MDFCQLAIRPPHLDTDRRKAALRRGETLSMSGATCAIFIMTSTFHDDCKTRAAQLSCSSTRLASTTPSPWRDNKNAPVAWGVAGNRNPFRFRRDAGSRGGNFLPIWARSSLFSLTTPSEAASIFLRMRRFSGDAAAIHKHEAWLRSKEYRHETQCRPSNPPKSKAVATDDLKSLPLREVEKKLESSPDGLTRAEAQKRLTQYGP